MVQVHLDQEGNKTQSLVFSPDVPFEATLLSTAKQFSIEEDEAREYAFIDPKSKIILTQIDQISTLAYSPFH